MAEQVPPFVPADSSAGRPAPVHPEPGQIPVPTFRAPDVQLLVQDIATSRRDLFEERRNSQNRIAEERERSRFEIEKIRADAGAQVKSLERENDALLRSLGRYQSEIDRLREENAFLRHVKVNGQEEKTPAPSAPVQDIVSQFNRPPSKTMVQMAQPFGVPKGAVQVTLQPPPAQGGIPIPLPPSV